MKLSYYSLFIILYALTGCSPQTQPIHYGQDGCAYCKMIIMQPKYGTELLTKKGKIFKFDSVECLAAFYLTKEVAHDEIHSLWVADFNADEVTFIDAIVSAYLRSDALKSPMGLNFTAFNDVPDVKAAQNQYDGQLLTWKEVLEIVQKEWLDQGCSVLFNSMILKDIIEVEGINESFLANIFDLIRSHNV